MLIKTTLKIQSNVYFLGQYTCKCLLLALILCLLSPFFVFSNQKWEHHKKSTISL